METFPALQTRGEVGDLGNFLSGMETFYKQMLEDGESIPWKLP